MSALFTPFTLKGITLKNRIGVSPMCKVRRPRFKKKLDVSEVEYFRS